MMLNVCRSVLLKLLKEKSYADLWAEAEQRGQESRICPVEVGYVGDSWQDQRSHSWGNLGAWRQSLSKTVREM